MCKSGAPERLLAKSGPQRVPWGRSKTMKNKVWRSLAPWGRSSIDILFFVDEKVTPGGPLGRPKTEKNEVWQGIAAQGGSKRDLLAI